MFCLFWAYIFGFGTSVSNMNVNSIMISKFLHMRTSLDSYVMMSIQALVGIGVMLIFTFTLYRPLLRKFGDVRILICVELLACITSALRGT